MSDGWQIGDVEVVRDVQCAMRDGCELAADVYRPLRVERPLPVLLLRLPYDRRVSTETNYAPPAWYARQGFIVVIQDCRGRYGSAGEFDPFVHEGEDGYDSVEWAARLDGSNGRVGMYGASYSGYLQLLTAATRPPALGAICPAIAGSDIYRSWFYDGGAFSLAFGAWWAASLGVDIARRRGDHDLEAALLDVLRDPPRWYGSARPYDLSPIADAIPFYREWLDHPERDEFWLRRSAEALYDRIDVPVLHIGGWYDSFNDGTVANFVHLAAAGRAASAHQQLLVGPWAHVPWGHAVGGVDFGPAAAEFSVDRAQIAFLRRHLDPTAMVADTSPDSAGVAADTSPAVRYFVLFENRWRQAAAWPPPGAVAESWYLHSDGGANSSGGDGRLERRQPGEEPCDTYAYNPVDPMPSNGGHSCCDEAIAPMGAFDQSRLEQRKDMLVYTSAPLEDDMLLAGPVRLELWVATTAPSADYTGKLCLVGSDSVVNIAEGIQRVDAMDAGATNDPVHAQASRAGRASAGTAARGPMRVEVALRNVAACVRAGQRLRLEVSGGSFPMYEVNPQTGANAAQAHPRDFVPATHAIFHTAAAPSHLSVTVLARGAAVPAQES